MSTVNEVPRPTQSRWLRRGWIAVALIPVSFFLSSAVGFGLYRATNSRRENIDSPLWVDVVGAVISTAIFLAPCVLAVVYGHRSSAEGDSRGQVPLTVGILAGLGYGLLVLVGLVAS